MFRKKEKANDADPTVSGQSSPDGDQADGAPATDAKVDVARVEAMGREVVETMQSLRELLESRAQALETCRDALEGHYRHLQVQRVEFAQQETELCEDLE